MLASAHGIRSEQPGTTVETVPGVPMPGPDFQKSSIRFFVTAHTRKGSPMAGRDLLQFLRDGVTWRQLTEHSAHVTRMMTERRRRPSQDSRLRRGRVMFVMRAAFLAAMLVICGGAFAEELVPPTPEEAEDIKNWIDQRCCRTNGCCRKVHESALILLPKNDVRVVTTGQILKRTGWSQDGQTWRCTCDWNDKTKHWDVHPAAQTRCVFPVPSGS